MLSSLFYTGLIEVMDDRSWKYQDSPQGLRRMNYCNEVQGFINYVISNPRNISGDGIRCPYKRYKNKKFIDLDVVAMHLLQKRFMEKYLYWYAYREPYVPHNTIVERMVESTSNTSNMHKVVDDNCNSPTSSKPKSFCEFINAFQSLARHNPHRVNQHPIKSDNTCSRNDI